MILTPVKGSAFGRVSQEQLRELLDKFDRTHYVRKVSNSTVHSSSDIKGMMQKNFVQICAEFKLDPGEIPRCRSCLSSSPWAG